MRVELASAVTICCVCCALALSACGPSGGSDTASAPESPPPAPNPSTTQLDEHTEATPVVPDAAGQTEPTTTGAPKAPFGRLIVTGLAGTELDEATRRALAEGRIGGIILMGDNVASVDQVRRLTSDVRQAARQAPRYFTPIICIDQEGGTVDRLRALPLEHRLPSAKELAAKSDALPGVAQAVGRYLEGMGINVDLAPVLDLDVPPYNPVVGTRSFGADPQSVARLGRLFMQGLDSANVRSVGKHFPGHGAVSEDSHTVLPTSRCSTDDLQMDHIAPFRELIEDGTLGAVMTAHVVYTAFDPERPATLSRRVVTALLRDGLGFDGVVFTDSLAMGAVASWGSPGKVAVESWAAGCDVVLTTDGAWVADGILEEGQLALDEGPLSVEQVERSCKRVDRWLDETQPEVASSSSLPTGGDATADVVEVVSACHVDLGSRGNPISSRASGPQPRLDAIRLPTLIWRARPPRLE